MVFYKPTIAEVTDAWPVNLKGVDSPEPGPRGNLKFCRSRLSLSTVEPSALPVSGTDRREAAMLLYIAVPRTLSSLEAIVALGTLPSFGKVAGVLMRGDNDGYNE